LNKTTTYRPLQNKQNSGIDLEGSVQGQHYSLSREVRLGNAWGLAFSTTIAPPSGAGGLDRFTYNSKELLTDLDLGWNDYGARMYMSEIGRWNGVDPLAEKNPNWSDYNYVLNSPIIYVDPDGRENIIYLQVEKSAYKDLTKAQINAIIKKANANFKEMGLKTQIKLLNGKVNTAKLDKTDAVAILGRKDEVITAAGNIDKSTGDDLSRNGFGSDDYPEYSENDAFGDGNNNIIAIESKVASKISKEKFKTSAEEGIAFMINHGAGHNSRLNHAGDRQYYGIKPGSKEYVPYGSIMTDGNNIYSNIAIKPLNTYVSSDSNKKGLIRDFYIKRFGNETPKPRQ
jgi:RHS repeat-associated protein